MPPKNTTLPLGKNDLTGQRFGKLTVVAFTGRYDSRANRLWDCVCDCGSHIEAQTVWLKRGRAVDCDFGKGHIPVIKSCERCGTPFHVTQRQQHFCSIGCRDRDLAGERFGRLVVISLSGSERRGRVWLCQCDCGQQTNVLTVHLNKGSVRSCGCLVVENNKATKTTHGDSTSREYRIWVGMKKRCNKPSHKAYPDYGGRGITVCARWQESYEAFFADMGRAPSDRHSIDRINNDGNYEPGNCRWATSAEQLRNQRPRNRRTKEIPTLIHQERLFSE